MVFKRGNELTRLLQPLWLLRARMAFVVSNLQSYLQVRDQVDAHVGACHGTHRVMLLLLVTGGCH